MTATASDSSSRRYHTTNSPYALPNDALEYNRLDAQAAAIVDMINGSPCIAPISSMTSVTRAADIGCGTGVPTVQIADIFPSATVFGVDVSPVPEADVDYKKTADDDLNRDIRDIFAPGGLDYIFGRMLELGIDNWPRYFSNDHCSLKSGGIVEHQDLDWAYYRSVTSERLSDSWRWYQTLAMSFQKAGLSLFAGSDAAFIIKNARLEIISIQTFEFSYIPSTKSPNSKATGKFVQKKLMNQYPEVLRKLLEPQGITGERLENHDIASEEGLH